MPTTPTVIFDVDRELLEVLEARLGPPIDSYLMGWQVWLHPIEDREVELELRLHPPASFAMPEGQDHHLLWDRAVTQLADGAERISVGERELALDQLWVLLEIYPVFGPATIDELRAWSESLLGRGADGAGEVDHDRLAGRFRREGHDADLPGRLRELIGAGGGQR